MHTGKLGVCNKSRHLHITNLILGLYLVVYLFSITMADRHKAVPILFCPVFGNHKTAARGEEFELCVYQVQVVLCNRAGFTLKLVVIEAHQRELRLPL